MADDRNTARREFLKTGAGLALGAGALLRPERALGANDRVRIGVCGLRGRGFDHIKGYSKIPGVEIVAVCDVDDNVTAKRVGDMEKMGLPKPRTYVDFRKMIEDRSIDAVSVATPNHWHSLMGIWACQAGKDLYLEKPCSHNWWEGRQLVAAVNKYGRIAQHGTQCRSSAGIREAIGHMRDGLIGDVYLARGLCYKWRGTIGHTPVEPVPPGVDYDLWLGPAPERPFTRNRFHYNWHWFWDTGNGDIGNQGPHEMDVARWGLGVTYPTKASAIGGHFLFDDDQQTPNVLSCAFEFDSPDGKRRMLEFEVRGWITNHEAGIGVKSPGGHTGIPPAGLTPDRPQTAAAKQPHLGPVSGMPETIGNIFYGRKGYLAVHEYTSYESYLGDHLEPGPKGHGGEHHFENFIDCVRSRNAEALHAPMEEGHISVTLVHLANASYRLGRSLHFDPETQRVIGDEEANALLRDGPRGYRAPYTVPEHV
jgi:predicted dehydrogenase